MVSFCSAWDSECWRYIYVDYMLPFKPFRITCFDSTAPGYYIAELHVLSPISLRPSLCGGFWTHTKKKGKSLARGKCRPAVGCSRLPGSISEYLRARAINSRPTWRELPSNPLRSLPCNTWYRALEHWTTIIPPRYSARPFIWSAVNRRVSVCVSSSSFF